MSGVLALACGGTPVLPVGGDIWKLDRAGVAGNPRRIPAAYETTRRRSFRMRNFFSSLTAENDGWNGERVPSRGARVWVGKVPA